MTRPAASLPPAYFDRLYAAKPDPWDFAASPYEQAKYDATLAVLGRPRYARALELGCSIGVLTQKLAMRCDALLAVDVAAAPLAAAAERCAGLPWVQFQRLQVPQQWPAGEDRYDLILLSEVVYYLAAEDVLRLADRVGASLAEEAEVLLVHWIGETDYPLSGDAAASLFIGQASFATPVSSARTDRYRLDLLRVTQRAGATGGG